VNNKLLNNESHDAARYQKLNQTQTKEYEDKISKLEKELQGLKESQKNKSNNKEKQKLSQDNEDKKLGITDEKLQKLKKRLIMKNVIKRFRSFETKLKNPKNT